MSQTKLQKATTARQEADLRLVDVQREHERTQSENNMLRESVRFPVRNAIISECLCVVLNMPSTFFAYGIGFVHCGSCGTACQDVEGYDAGSSEGLGGHACRGRGRFCEGASRGLGG